MATARHPQPLTIWSIGGTLHINVQVLVPLQSLLEQLDFLRALHLACCGIRLALAISFHLVELDHLLDTLEILFLDIQFKLELRKHQLDPGTQVLRVILDEI